MICTLLICCTDNSKDQLPDLHSHKNAKQFPSVDGFYFVGETELNPGVYQFDIETRKSKIFWNSRTEKVIDLAVSEDFKTAFFITATRFGLAGSFPFLEKARLYRINPEINKAEFVRDIGNIIQFYTYWTEEGNYSLTINYFDSKVNTYIIQNKQLYNQFGRILSDQFETSDLMISGYPILKSKDIRLTSYDGRYKIFNVSDSVFIRDNKTRIKIFVRETDQKLNGIEWIPDKSIVVFSTLKKAQEAVNISDMASLNLFDLNGKKLLKTFQGSALYRFAVTNEFLIFESGFQSSSRINILELSELGQYAVINIKGGCGLRNIPQNPYQYN